MDMNKKTTLTEKQIKPAVNETMEDALNEGIDFDHQTKTVSYNPSHEENVDTSLDNNPTLDGNIVPNVQVWSIFKRKIGMRGDGNPLVCALTGEGGWTFRSDNDKEAIEIQIDAIADKFVKLYPVGITILMPSDNALNQRIVEVIMSKSKDVKLIKGLIRKMTTEEVDDIVLDFGSKFREYYKDKFTVAYFQLGEYLDLMDKECGATFSRHMIKDPEMRDVLDFTLKLSDDRFARFANKINGQNVLIIDDTISGDQTITQVCEIMSVSYAPKSITVLTLLSKLY